MYCYWDNMTINGRRVMLLWNARQVFTWTVLCLKKKKKKVYFYFYLMFPKKKSQDSYTNNLQWDHAKQFWVYTTIIPPSLLLLYTIVINNRKLNGMCLVGKFHLFTKQKKPTMNIQDSCYFVSASQFTNLFLFRRHMGLELLAAQFYPTTPQKAQMTVQTL